MKKRNIALAVLFSIITFGIYGIYWYCCLTNDSNKINPKEATASAGLAVLFNIITFSIYSIYWSYKMAKKLDENVLLYVLLSLFGFDIIVWALAQDHINKIAATAA